MLSARLSSTLLVAVITLAPALARAELEQDFRFAENAYLYGEYEKVLQRLTPLVEPSVLVREPAKLIRAYELLALCAFYLGRIESSEAWFERLVRTSPDHRLDPLNAPPEAITQFDRIKVAHAEELALIREALRKNREAAVRKQREELTIETRIEYRQSSRLVALMPFGVGQFQNNDATTGAIFLTTELVATALSAGLLIAVENLRKSNGQFESSDFERARNLQTGQLVSGGIALALMVGGAAHALANFEEVVEVRRNTYQPGHSRARSSAPGVLFSLSW